MEIINLLNVGYKYATNDSFYMSTEYYIYFYNSIKCTNDQQLLLNNEE